MELDLIVNAFVQRYAKAWSAIPANFYDKWLDSNDRILAVGYMQ